MTLHVHETSTGWIVAYTGQWVNGTLKPIPKERWFTVDEARERFEQGKPLEVVEASDHDDDKLLGSRWVVGMTHPRWARAQFLTPGRSIAASISYELLDDGRLFLGQRADYVYPDLERLYTQTDAVTITSAYYKPDGTGAFAIRDVATRESMYTRFKDADFSALRFDWAEFGNWDTLANPENGILPADFAMTPL